MPAAAPAAPTAVRIRRFTSDDYPAMVNIHNTVFPDYADTIAEWRFNDERKEPHIRWNRYVAEEPVTGEIVAFGNYGQYTDMYHPRKFTLGVTVMPEHQGKGIGTALYEHVMAALAEFDPLVVRTHAREDYGRGIAFLQKRGFEEEMRDWESRLNVAAFDPVAFAGAEERVAGQGIVIKSLAELAAEDSDRDRKLYDLDWTITLDMPAPDTLTQPSYEHFQKNVLENPDFLPDAWFMALDGDKYVGESALWRSQANDSFYVGATGVLREYRRRGIAMALKLRAIAYAKSVGCPEIKTWNEQGNRPMLSINEALGFVKQPAWISFAKKLSDETE
jgi:GNAT superfamily N-acetyltransferase